MATEQNPIQRQILTPTVGIQAGSGFESLGTAATALATQISNKFSDAAIEQAAQQGLADGGVSGKAPKTLMPGLTAATSAYNKGVISAETNRIIESGREQIEEAFIKSSNPATFNSSTPAEFNAQVTGIVEGTLENARPSVRAHVQSSLTSLSRQASMKMLSHSIVFDNKKTIADFTFDIDNYARDRKNAAIAGDKAEIERIDGLIAETKVNYSEQSEQISALMPKINKKLEQQKDIDNVLAEYSHATAEEKPKFLSEFLENKSNLPFDTLEKAATELFKLHTIDTRLKHDLNAQEVSIVTDNIKTGRINDIDQILSFEHLNIAQKLHAISSLELHKQRAMSAQHKIFVAQNDILSNRPAAISGSTKDTMFHTAITNLERKKGKPASLTDMEQSALGQNEYSASGMPHTPMGTNIPALDRIISAQLTSGVPKKIVEASAIANNMINTQHQPNSLHLEGKPAAISSLANTLIRGDMDPNTAATSAYNAVMNVGAPELTERTKRLKSFAVINHSSGRSEFGKYYKEAFGLDAGEAPGALASGTDLSFGVFKKIFSTNYLLSGSKEIALKLTMQQMRGWGTSQYFEPGMIGSPVPEKELSIAQIGNVFPNQLNIKLQKIITENKKLRDDGTPVLPIEWAHKSSEINREGLTDKKLVFDSLGGGKTPTIKVDGYESKVFLIPSSHSKIGNELHYNLGYYDRLGATHLLPDTSNPDDNTAWFSPKGLEIYAPGIFEANNQAALIAAAKNIEFSRIEASIDTAKRGKLTPSYLIPTYILGKIQQMSEGESDPEKLVGLLKQRIQKKPVQKAKDNK